MTSRAPAENRLSLRGPVGNIQGIEESPAGRDPAAIALLCHPHPLHGGTMDNKVVHSLARSFLHLGCAAVRFNYRGVGESEGSYADGAGETDDAIAVAEWMRAKWPDHRFYLGGFSFGAMVSLLASGSLFPDGLVTVALPTARVPNDQSQPACPWLMLQGDNDDVVDADEVVAWLNGLAPGPEL